MRDIGFVVVACFFVTLLWPEYIGETAAKVVSAYNNQLTSQGE